MPEHTDKPERDTSPSGEISARQNEDGTYEIVAGDSSAANEVPDADSNDDAKTSSPDTKEQEDASIRSPLTIGLLVLTLVAAGGTVAYFAMGSSNTGAEQAVGEDDPSFRPYAGDEAPAPQAAQESAAQEQAAAEPDASSVEQDVGPKERKTEIIVLEEGVDETDPDEAEDESNTRIDPATFRKIEVGPGAAARIKDSVRLKVDPAKLRNIKFTNGDIPEAEGQETRDRNKEGVEQQGPSEQQPAEDMEDQVEDPVIE